MIVAKRFNTLPFSFAYTFLTGKNIYSMYMEDCIQFRKFQKLHYRGNVAIRSSLQQCSLLWPQFIAGLHVTSRRPCWWSRTKAFPPLGTKLHFHVDYWRKHSIVDCKTVGFFSKSVKKSVKRRVRVCSRPFVWLVVRTWIRKNTDCFVVWFYCIDHQHTTNVAALSHGVLPHKLTSKIIL